MSVSKIGRYIKAIAPTWMKNNQVLVVIYDTLFNEKDPPRRRLEMATFKNGAIDFQAEEIVDSDSVFFSSEEPSEIKRDPIALRIAIFQTLFEADAAGKVLQLDIALSDPLADLLAAICFTYGIGWREAESSDRTTFKITQRKDQRFIGWDKGEAWAQSLQFALGLRARRSLLIITRPRALDKHDKNWYSFVKKITRWAGSYSGNIIVFENNNNSTVDDPLYTKCLGCANLSLVSGVLESQRFIQAVDELPGSLTYSESLLQSLNSCVDLEEFLFKNRKANIEGLSCVDTGSLGGDYSLKLVKGNLPGPISLAQSAESVDVIEGVQRYIVQSFEASGRLDGADSIDTISDISNSTAFLQWGASESKRRRRLRRNAKNSGAPLLFIEDGFVRSVEIGLKGSPGLSFLVDDLAPYYEARAWSRMERVLASGWELGCEERQKAADSIHLIREFRISKYNHAPDIMPSWSDDSRRKILLVDQRYGDQSVEAGLGSAEVFREMVVDALAEKGTLVVLKRHPDATIGEKGSYFSRANLGSILDDPSIIFHDTETNPHALFDAVDEVWCVTSGMGFEALIAGKAVKAYGAPFYAGWGLTSDKIKLDWRRRQRSIEEVFYCAYLARSVYFDPVKGKKCDLPDLLSQVRSDRDQYLSRELR